MPSRRDVDTARFAMTPRRDVARSAFDVSHSHKTTFGAGVLVPIYCEEVLPADSFKGRMTAFARLSTPIVPVMDNIVFESFFFFVPNRLVWQNWEAFMGEQANPGDTTQYLVPYVTIDNVYLGVGTVYDYFGITLNNHATQTVMVNSLPFRAYQLIWNDWFRDEDLQNPITIPLGDGPDPVTQYGLVKRSRRPDYFSTARPWPQKPIQMNASWSMGQSGAQFGEPFVPGGRMYMPQSGAPVSGLGFGSSGSPVGGGGNYLQAGGRTSSWPTVWAGEITPVRAESQFGFPNVRVLINDIRTASIVQSMMERNTRGGTRYAEIVRSHFGVTSPDARLGRPEYLGGGRTYVTVNPVAQTSATGATGTTTVLGELAGIGTIVGQEHFFSGSFTEHGYIIGLINVRAEITYQNGINRMWFRRSQYDFYWPGLEGLGEQAILQREIFCDGGIADSLVFGYQERWSEYKYKPSRISGAFRSSSPQPLDMWHLATNYVTTVGLNATFLEESPPMDRVLQVDTNYGEQFLLDAYFQERRVRAMPMHSLPGVMARL